VSAGDTFCGVTALLALLSSGLWGTADFLGGTLTRRAHALAVVGFSQAFALALMVVVTWGLGSWGDPTGYLPWAVAGGLVGMGSLVAFYAALSLGTMGVVAPVAACGVVVPVVIGLVQGERPAAAADVGILLAIVGVVLASGPELRGAEEGTGRGGWRALALAAVAAVGFGLVLWLVAQGAKSSVAMTLLTQRASSVLVACVVLLAVRRAGGLRRGDAPALAVIGLFDVSANGSYALASQSGLLAVVAVLGSLYPVATILLARVFHGERLAPLQRYGVALALVGVALIGAGGTG
jgi:drug/metabolite transporter (DMT)-like permease